MGLLISYTEVNVSANLKVIILICKYFLFGNYLRFCTLLLLVIPIRHRCFQHEEDIGDDLW
jgi:hypothetical protein